MNFWFSTKLFDLAKNWMWFYINKALGGNQLAYLRKDKKLTLKIWREEELIAI